MAFYFDTSRTIKRADNLIDRLEQIEETLDVFSSEKGFKKATKREEWDGTIKTLGKTMDTVEDLQTDILKFVPVLQKHKSLELKQKDLLLLKIASLPEPEEANPQELVSLGELGDKASACDDRIKKLSELEENLERVRDTAEQTDVLCKKFLNYSREKRLPFNLNPSQSKKPFPRDPFPSNVIGFFGNALTFMAKKTAQFIWDHPVITLSATAAVYTYSDETLNYVKDTKALLEKQFQSVVTSAVAYVSSEKFQTTASTALKPVAGLSLLGPFVLGGMKKIFQKGILNAIADAPGRAAFVSTPLAFTGALLVGAPTVTAFTAAGVTAGAFGGLWAGKRSVQKEQSEPAPAAQ